MFCFLFFVLIKDYYQLDKPNLSISIELYRIALHLINRFDEFDKNEHAQGDDYEERSTVLVFLPGIHEIIQMETILKDQWFEV